MAELFDKVHNYRYAKDAIELGIYPYFRALSDTEGAIAHFEGKEVVMIGSNNYLGLTTHPTVRKAAIDAIEHYGTSVTGSPLPERHARTAPGAGPPVGTFRRQGSGASSSPPAIRRM